MAAVPLTFRCHTGLTRTAVPLRINGDVVAYLWTGWVTHHDSTSAEAIADDWEPVRQIDRLPMSTAPATRGRVVLRERYSAMIDMLAAFAAAVQPFTATRVASRQPERCLAIARATGIIADEFHQSVSLRSVARRCNVSSTYFSGLFKRTMGATFTDYLTRFRIEKAKELLSASDRRVSEIAYACGFGSHSQFNRMFHRMVGTSPRTFRGQNRSAA